MGHMIDEYLNTLARNQLVKNLNIGSRYKTICEPCMQAKIFEKSFGRIKEKQSKRQLELLHIDLMGPMTKSLSGSRYTMVIVDDFSERVFVYFLKEKSEAKGIH